MTRSYTDILAGGAVLGLSLLLFTQVLPGRFEGVALARNPMAFPRFLLGLTALGGLALLLRGMFGGGTRVELAADWRRVAALGTLVALYLAAFGPFGFIPSTVVFLPLAMILLGFQRPLVIGAVTVGTITVLWFLFAEVFVIRPPGIGFDDLFRNLGIG